jgi:hypothetical protein
MGSSQIYDVGKRLWDHNELLSEIAQLEGFFTGNRKLESPSWPHSFQARPPRVGGDGGKSTTTE